MPTGDVSDLRDVFDAINKLCETMKTSYDENEYEDCSDVVVRETETEDLVDPSDVVVRKVETYVAETWREPTVEATHEEPETVVSDSEPVTVEPAPASEMYYTASSEVSLISEDFQDRPPNEQSSDSEKERDDRNSVIAGHVAAMRERFESMTRANTPCPDLARSTSPSLDVFRNITPSPDRLDKS